MNPDPCPAPDLDASDQTRAEHPSLQGDPPPSVTAEWLLEQERAFWSNRRLNYLCVAFAVFGTCCFVCLLGLASAGCALPAAIWPAAIVLPAAAFLGVNATHVRWRARCESVARFAAVGDARMIAPLAAGLSMDEYPRHPAWRREVARALTTILDGMADADGERISDRSWERLATFLKLWYSPEIEELQIAILRAAASAGAQPVLPAAERIARLRPSAPPEDRVYAAAVECLTGIRDRIRDRRRIRALLRPASAPNAPDDLLLRPAAGAPKWQDASLLRPAEP